MMCAGAPVNGLCLRRHGHSLEMIQWVISRHTSTHARAGAPVPYSCAGSRPAQECPVSRRTSACALVRQDLAYPCAGACTGARVARLTLAPVCGQRKSAPFTGAPAHMRWCARICPTLAPVRGRRKSAPFTGAPVHVRWCASAHSYAFNQPTSRLALVL